jgi:hypothetical protein
MDYLPPATRRPPLITRHSSLFSHAFTFGKACSTPGEDWRDWDGRREAGGGDGLCEGRLLRDGVDWGADNEFC